MAVEVVLLVPVLVALMMLVVAFGRYVDTRGEIEAVARDAVRAASLERDPAAAAAAAQGIATQTLPAGASCQPVHIGGAFVAGETISARLDCRVSYAGLGMIGLPGSVAISGESFAPLDTLRRTG